MHLPLDMSADHTPVNRWRGAAVKRNDDPAVVGIPAGWVTWLIQLAGHAR